MFQVQFRPTVSPMLVLCIPDTLNFVFTDSARPKGLTGYLNLISQGAKIEGFIVYVVSIAIHVHVSDTASRFDYKDRIPEASQYLGSLLRNGTLKRKFHIVEGLENAPQALNLLFNGGNTGKLCVICFRC